MGFIKKYKMFTEELIMSPPKKIETAPKKDILVSSVNDVVDRFARLYKDLSKQKKQEINDYFK